MANVMVNRSYAISWEISYLARYMYTLNINQSNVSTKLKKHDFVIPDIEVTAQLIDLRSSATLCWSVEVRPWPFRRLQFEGTVVSNVPSGVWHLDCILITWPTRRSRRLRMVRLKGLNLAHWVSSAVDIFSGQVMPNAARTNWRWDAPICRITNASWGQTSIHMLQLFQPWLKKGESC